MLNTGLMKRVQVLLEPDCHKIIKCVCAQMDITMSEFFNIAGFAFMSDQLDEHKHLKRLVESIQLTPGSRAYKAFAKSQTNESA